MNFKPSEAPSIIEHYLAVPSVLILVTGKTLNPESKTPNMGKSPLQTSKVSLPVFGSLSVLRLDQEE